VAEKKATRKRSVRYLLSADRRLQKLSLKKIQDRLGGSKPRAQAARSKEPAAKSDATPPSSMRWAIAAGFAVVLVGAVMMSAMPSTPIDEPVPESAAWPINATAKVTKPAVTKTEPAKPAAPKPAPPVPSTTETPAPTSPAADPAAKPAVPVTLVGCLQRDGETFWLKNASGDDAPKSRSWKTGFFTRRPSRINVAGPRSALTSNVDTRVEVSGMLNDRELQTRSLRRVAATCD
jgi:hypothetical protein